MPVRRIYAYAYSPAEIDALDGEPTERERDLRFCKIRTMKECYLKAIGSGLNGSASDLMGSFYVLESDLPYAQPRDNIDV
jgi:phosphopantetheinyl transferase